jgi:hypothetical protein
VEKGKAMARVLTYLTSPETWKIGKNKPSQGVIKRDWVPTGRIDFATRLNGVAADEDQPNEFKLIVEERRIVESVTGLDNLEIQWRLATLREAKVVISRYHEYLSENSLIESVFDEALSLPSPKKLQKVQEKSEA